MWDEASLTTNNQLEDGLNLQKYMVKRYTLNK